jgi:hypothetical protein
MLRFFLLQVGGKRVKRDSCILQCKRVLQWLQEGSRRWKTGQAGPAKVLQEGSRQIKRWFGPKTGQRGPQRCCKRAADRSRGDLVLRRDIGFRKGVARGQQTCQEVAWSSGSPPAG